MASDMKALSRHFADETVARREEASDNATPL